LKAIGAFANTAALLEKPFLTSFCDCRKIYERVTTCQAIRNPEIVPIGEIKI
jgi:hypothetical protein